MAFINFQQLANFIWSVADLLRGPYRPPQYERVMLPLTVLRRQVLTQEGVIATICDPACGTGGMLAEAQNWIRAHNEQATVKVYGQLRIGE